MTEDELKRIEARWKSDVDLKLDKLVRFAGSYEQLLSLLLEREQRRKKVWDAIIEKSTFGLIAAGAIVVGNALVAYVKEVFKR